MVLHADELKSHPAGKREKKKGGMTKGRKDVALCFHSTWGERGEVKVK